MFVKKFEAESLEQGLKNIRQELGPDTLILGTQKKKGGLLGKTLVEITAAYEKKAVPAASSVDEATLMKVFPHRKYGTFEQSTPKDSRTSKAIKHYMDIQDEPVVATKKANKSSKLEESFIRLGFSNESSRDLALKLSFDFTEEDVADPLSLDRLKIRLIMGHLKTLNHTEFMDQKSWAVVGTSGSGKTSGIIKLALLLRSMGKSVFLSSLDSRKVTSAAEMTCYSKLLKVPLKKVEKNTSAATQLIDTPSLQLNSEGNNIDLTGKFEGLNTSVILTLEGTNRLTEMMRVVETAQAAFPVRAILLTKMDIAFQRGVIYDLQKRTKLPLLSISHSSSFKNSLKLLSQRELAQYILRRGEL
jgi:flagellar biosynthesis GTPase FlhF